MKNAMIISLDGLFSFDFAGPNNEPDSDKQSFERDADVRQPERHRADMGPAV